MAANVRGAGITSVPASLNESVGEGVFAELSPRTRTTGLVRSTGAAAGKLRGTEAGAWAPGMAANDDHRGNSKKPQAAIDDPREWYTPVESPRSPNDLDHGVLLDPEDQITCVGEYRKS